MIHIVKPIYSARYLLSSKQHLIIARSASGFGLAEAVTSACFVIVAVIVSLDCWFMVTAARITDAACRDAARAASLAPNSDTATNAALAVAQSYAQYCTSYMTLNLPTVKYNNTSTAPSVTVITTSTVKPLLPIALCGSTFRNVDFKQQYTFPIVPSRFGVQANNLNP